MSTLCAQRFRGLRFALPLALVLLLVPDLAYAAVPSVLYGSHSAVMWYGENVSCESPGGSERVVELRNQQVVDTNHGSGALSLCGDILSNSRGEGPVMCGDGITKEWTAFAVHAAGVVEFASGSSYELADVVWDHGNGSPALGDTSTVNTITATFREFGPDGSFTGVAGAVTGTFTYGSNSLRACDADARARGGWSVANWTLEFVLAD